MSDACQIQESEIQMSSETAQLRESVAAPSKGIDPLYLFACKFQWRRTCNEEAFWELLCALTSPDPSTRALARALLGNC